MQSPFVLIHRVSVAFLLLASIGIFLWLLAANFVVTGVLDVSYDFSRPSPFITRLTPENKVDPIDYGATDSTQRMHKDPAGFTVRLPRAFRHMTVELAYQMEREQPLNVGVQVKRGVWSPYLRAVEPIRAEDGWTIGRVEFPDLSRFDFSGNSYQLIFNAPTMKDDGDAIRFTKIRVIAERDPWTFSSFFPRIWQYIKK